MLISFALTTVLPAPEAEKREFLVKKGLTESEIRTAFDTVRQPSSRSYPGMTGAGGWHGRSPPSGHYSPKYHLNPGRSTLTIIAETILLPVTAAIGIIGVVNFFWVSTYVSMKYL